MSSESIKFKKDNGRLLLIYRPEQSEWLKKRLQNDGSVTVKKTFTFTEDDILKRPSDEDSDNDEWAFVLGVSVDKYYRIAKSILDLKHNLLLDAGMTVKIRTFIAPLHISIFRKIDELIDEPIIVGGNRKNAIPLAEFELLLRTFPTGTELEHYARSRIARVLKDYLGTISDAESKLNDHLKKKSFPHKSPKSLLKNFEIQKFEYIRDEIRGMLGEAESYKEKDWQKKILPLLLMMFPRYIAVLENVHIKDFYAKPGKTTDRYIDLMLVDANGNIDIIELKKPFSNALLRPHPYRNNYIPRTELSGAAMQAEKYLFHLNKWGQAGEKEIFLKHKSELPSGLTLQITNPKALILLGRDNDFTANQRFDFEIIRRKYANMMDIMTYDDLLRRLDNIIVMMSRHIASSSNAGVKKKKA